MKHLLLQTSIVSHVASATLHSLTDLTVLHSINLHDESAVAYCLDNATLAGAANKAACASCPGQVRVVGGLLEST